MRPSTRLLLATVLLLAAAGCGSSSTGEQADPTTPPVTDEVGAQDAEPTPADTDTTTATPAPTPTDPAAPTPSPQAQQPPANTLVTDAQGWTVFAQPVTITVESAAGVTPGGATPEDAVAHFYASRIRRDRRWQDVVPPARGRSRNLTRALRELESWRYFTVRVEAKKCDSDTQCGIRIYMEVEADGDRDTGTDQVGVEQIDGRWFVTQPPM